MRAISLALTLLGAGAVLGLRPAPRPIPSSDPAAARLARWECVLCRTRVDEGLAGTYDEERLGQTTLDAVGVYDEYPQPSGYDDPQDGTDGWGREDYTTLLATPC